MTAADRIIRWTTAGAVVGVAAVAAVASYEHAYALVRAHGEAGWTGRLVPLTVDGLIYASSMVMLDSARRGRRVPARVAARPGDRGDAGGERDARPRGRACRRGGGRVAGGRTCRLLRASDDGDPEFSGTGGSSLGHGHDEDPLQEQAAEIVRRPAGGAARPFRPCDPRSAPRRPATCPAPAEVPRHGRREARRRTRRVAGDWL